MQEQLTESQLKIESIQEELSELLTRFDSLDEAWEDRNVKKLLAKANAKWVAKRNWIVFLTLTFEKETAYDVAKKKFKRLVMELNKSVFGNNYTRIVGHSYFSYVLGIEYQRREVIHFHVLIDKPVNFQLIHTLWNHWAGFAWADRIENFYSAVNYVTKYISKGGEIIPHFADEDYKPLFLPHWWKTESLLDQD